MDDASEFFAPLKSEQLSSKEKDELKLELQEHLFFSTVGAVRHPAVERLQQQMEAASQHLWNEAKRTALTNDERGMMRFTLLSHMASSPSHTKRPVVSLFAVMGTFSLPTMDREMVRGNLLHFMQEHPAVAEAVRGEESLICFFSSFLTRRTVPVLA